MEETALAGLILDDRERKLFRVDRQVFTDKELFEQERRKVFDRCWLYAGHESELAKPGDFVTRNVGGRPLLLTRDQKGGVNAFLNSCPHRGKLVVREKSGNSRNFTCFYHAWSFDTAGALIGVPGEDAYSDAFDRKDHGLAQVPRFETYRGFLFVCYDRDCVDLMTYFGEQAREQIDHIIDSAAADLEVVQGAQNYSMRANWKLLVENSIDGYHGLPTHQRFFRKYLSDLGLQTNVASLASTESRGRSLGNGHAVSEKPRHMTGLTAGAADELATQRHVIEQKLGKERAHQALGFDRNLFIFPNLILISTWRTVRTFYPVAPDYMEVDAWALMPRGESQGLRQKRLENFISFLGPAGFGTPDDVSGLEECQRGFAASREARWSDISRGMAREHPVATDELQMRAFWRRWHALMQDRTEPMGCGDRD